MARFPRRSLVWIAPVLLLVAAGAGALFIIGPADPGAVEVIITIPRGASTVEIGRRLEAAGLVRNASHFVLATRFLRTSQGLRHGEYRLSAAMPLLAIAETIARGDVILHPVTIPEGFTAEQIAQLLEARGLVNADEFRAVIHSGAPRFSHDFLQNLPQPSLEGYLFPDTYSIPRYLDAEAVVAIFLARFSDAVVPVWRASGTASSLHDIMTMASLVEREARVPEERPLIAGVLYNRLARGWRLEVDATVLYALGRHKTIVTFEDLKVNSPYNTYLHAGLPPGPIANPGLAAIGAALHPARTDYLFYVARPDGSHAFSRTLREHEAAIRRYRRP